MDMDQLSKYGKNIWNTSTGPYMRHDSSRASVVSHVVCTWYVYRMSMYVSSALSGSGTELQTWSPLPRACAVRLAIHVPPTLSAQHHTRPHKPFTARTPCPPREATRGHSRTFGARAVRAHHAPWLRVVGRGVQTYVHQRTRRRRVPQAWGRAPGRGREMGGSGCGTT